MGRRAIVYPTPAMAKYMRNLVIRDGIRQLVSRFHIAREQILCIAGRLPSAPTAMAIVQQHMERE